MAAPTAAQDLNEVILAAVNARIEAAVAEAMASDEGVKPLVTAALMQEIEVKDGSSYRTKKVTYLSEVLRKTIQAATEGAVKRIVEEKRDEIEERVRESLSAGIDQFAKGITESFVNQATRGYGIRVSMRYPGMEED